MNKIIFALFFSVLIHTVQAQVTDADAIVGHWVSEDKESRIEISKSGTAYIGKLLWAKEMFESDGRTARKDVQNRDEKLKERSLEDMPVLFDFVFEDGIWDDGKMYDPKSGKTYHSFMKLRDKLLEIRSYIGIPLLGKSTYWQRVTKPAI